MVSRAAEIAPLGQLAQLGIPSTLLKGLLARLVKAAILVEVLLEDPADPGYAPARDPYRLTPASILEALEDLGEDLAEPGLDRDGKNYAEVLQDFDRCLERSPANRPLHTLDSRD